MPVDMKKMIADIYMQWIFAMQPLCTMRFYPRKIFPDVYVESVPFNSKSEHVDASCKC